MKRRLRRYLAGIGAAGLSLILTAAGGPTAAAAHAVTLHPALEHAPHIYTGSTVPPTTATCQARSHINCYGPQQFAVAYGLTKAFAAGDTGKGRTIAIVDSFGSPTIEADLATFDSDFGIKPPPSFRIIQPVGAVTFDAGNSTEIGWAQETTLDVEYAHAFAPDANILLVETPTAETEGVVGFPDIVAAENYVIDHDLADVITQSFGATEDTFDSPQQLLEQRSAFVNAARHNVTVLGSSGDAGATGAIFDGSADYPYRVNSWPSADPLVTSVGGTQLHLDAAGHRTSPDVVWNDGHGAGGGGVSKVFARPSYQDNVMNVVGTHRGTPDISMSAAVDGGALVYYSFVPGSVGYHIFGGTSEASPQLAGVVALLDQAAGRRVGQLNPLLYAAGATHQPSIVDVTSGDNSFDGVVGYPATQGYDLASGWGTLDVGTLIQQVTSLLH